MRPGCGCSCRRARPGQQHVVAGIDRDVPASDAFWPGSEIVCAAPKLPLASRSRTGCGCWCRRMRVQRVWRAPVESTATTPSKPSWPASARCPRGSEYRGRAGGGGKQRASPTGSHEQACTPWRRPCRQPRAHIRRHRNRGGTVSVFALSRLGDPAPCAASGRRLCSDGTASASRPGPRPGLEPRPRREAAHPRRSCRGR